MDKEQRKWLAFLVTRRDIYIIPTTNCLGYIQNTRLDAGVDPNRDFPYARQDDQCFLSSTANIVRELFSRSIIQSVVTFHGGISSISYEWGSFNHEKPNDRSPGNASYCVTSHL